MISYAVGYFEPKRGQWPLVKIEGKKQTVIAWGSFHEVQVMMDELNSLTSGSL